MRHALDILLWATLICLACGGDDPPIIADPPEIAAPAIGHVGALSLADAPLVEHQTLQSLIDHPSWPRRAIAAVRLERYGCAESQVMLIELLGDQAWQTRAFAVRTLGRRKVADEGTWFLEEDDPRVIRTALRHRYRIDPERLDRGVRFLARSNDLEQKMLAVEIGAASGDEALETLARQTARTIILRMNRIDAGTLSPRMATMIGSSDPRRAHLWQQWLLRRGRRFALQPALALPEQAAPMPLGHLSGLDPERFSALEQYIEKLGERHLDLVILIDCTASMSGELAAAQGGIDDLMMFVQDMVRSARVGIIAYRDRRDEFEVKGWDLTSNVHEARQFLWNLTAAGGGDHRELVYEALEQAYTQMSWDLEHTKVLVILGDAPPHVGLGGRAVTLARRAHEGSGLTTHAIQAVPEGKTVKHFPQIAEAGGGRAVTLQDDDALVAQITGLTIGGAFEDEFREFFAVYLELCR
jgi:hypothetical protein